MKPKSQGVSPYYILRSFLFSFFNFFASLKLAVFLLVVLGVTLAAGTFIESASGTKAAQQMVYHTAAFSLLLGVLAMNLAFAALARLPWQKKHVGFVMTHAGIIMIIFGSWMTTRFAIDGQLALAEGERGNQISVDVPLLQIFNSQTKQSIEVPFKLPPRQWEGNKPFILHDFDDVAVNLLAFFPHSKPVEKIVPKAGGSSAVEFDIFNENMRMGGRLLEEQGKDSMDLGPAVVRFSSQEIPLPTKKSASSDSLGDLIFNYQGKQSRVSVSKALTKEVSIPNTPFKIKINRYLSHAIVENNQLVDRGEAAVNPACEFVILGKKTEEKHTAFAFFPDFPTLHGRAPSQTGLKIHFEASGLEQGASANELRIIKNASGKLFYQTKTQQTVIPPVPVEVGKEYATGWMHLKFLVKTFFPEAELKSYFEPLPLSPQEKNPRPVVLMGFQKNGQEAKLWLQRGDHQFVFSESAPLHVIYGEKNIPLGFDIELKKFMIDYYPGSERPAAFKSAVKLIDPSKGVDREVEISMNKPLSYRGFKVFQSGYQLSEGRPKVSIFSVGRDPGIPVKYAGSIVMILGVLFMFYLKRFSSSKPLYSNESEKK
ncbi:MAG: cytochrome c biogenesis protein ResB [Candidatus Omnitrophica bacterium]|nr:cytochrome c biogenesis protein ResB [Candidatus Omnitrophota bacterium]